jgi:phage gpG-like protein
MSIVDFKVENDRELTAKIVGIADRLQREIILSLNTVNTQLQRSIVSDKLSGQVLKSHSGNLKRSIVQIPAEQDGDVITGGVGLASTAPYGLIHEFGGVIHIPEIRPRNAKSLHWVGKGGEEVFAMHAAAHDVHMPERSFMRSSFSEFRDRIEEEMREAVRRAAA